MKENTYMRFTNNNKNKLVILKLTNIFPQLVSKELLSLINQPFTEFTHITEFNSMITYLGLDFGFGSYSLIEQPKILIPHYMVRKVVPFKHILSPEQLPDFAQGEDGIDLIFPNTASKVLFTRAYYDICNNS